MTSTARMGLTFMLRRPFVPYVTSVHGSRDRTRLGVYLSTRRGKVSAKDQCKFAAASATNLTVAYSTAADTHAPLQVPRSYCYNATIDLQRNVSARTSKDVILRTKSDQVDHTDVSSDCPREGPRFLPDGTKHSWCYCYDNESMAHARNPVLEDAQRWHLRSRGGQGDLGEDFYPLRLSLDLQYNSSVLAGEGRAMQPRGGGIAPRVDAHGNFTYSGDNADRHTVEAMAVRASWAPCFSFSRHATRPPQNYLNCTPSLQFYAVQLTLS